MSLLEYCQYPTSQQRVRGHTVRKELIQTSHDLIVRIVHTALWLLSHLEYLG